jgi:hypothetical protein
MRRLQGRFDLPVVTVGGQLGGLSHDGGTLVLAPARGPAGGSTRFAVLDAALADAPRYVALEGSFAFDALSPDGRRLFLIEHLPPVGSAHYQVRMLDLSTGVIEPAPLIDKRFPDEQMHGYPLARTESIDGTWVYTLYRDGARNFVHALLTDGAAFCIDLPAAETPDGPWRLAPGPNGTSLDVTNVRDGTRSAVDLESFTVRGSG